MFHITQSKARTAGKLAREADCMAAVQDCDGVVRLRGLFEDGSSAYMVMDHCTGGDLEELVQVRWLTALQTLLFLTVTVLVRNINQLYLDHLYLCLAAHTHHCCMCLLQKKGALAEHQAAVVLSEVLRVVAACHRRSVCHGDIKVLVYACVLLTLPSCSSRIGASAARHCVSLPLCVSPASSS